VRSFWAGALKEAGIIAILAVALALGSNQMRADGLSLYPNAQAADPAVIAAVELSEALRLHREGSALFLDARDPDFFELERIRGALSLPADGFDARFGALKRRLMKAPRIITYCDDAHCPLAERLAQRLAAMGLTGVMVLPGGLDMWRKAGGPREGEEVSG
jgi:rhodanese-related sulfurtransferase